MADQLRFDERVVIVTGAGQGLGRAYALLLANRGAQVVVNDIGCDELGAGRDATLAVGVVDEILAAGGAAIANTDDVRTVDGGGAIVAAALDAFGRVDAVISNAALNTHHPIEETTFYELEMHLALDPVGAFNVARAAWPHMVARKYGRLVFSSSSAQFGGATVAAYGAAKAGTWGLARCLAAAGTGVGITANTVAPFGFSRMVPNNPNLTPEGVEARRKFLPAELAAPFAAALVHESCPVNGELFAVGGGRITHVFLGETSGYYNPELTLEDVIEHWDTILDRHEFEEVGLATHVARFQTKVPGFAEAVAAPR